MRWAIIKRIAAFILSRVYRVEIHGREHLENLDERVMIVANHTSFLDGVLLYLCLPMELTFAINTEIAKARYVQWLMRWVDFFPMDSTNPLSIRALIKRVNEGGCVMIFPEGRITLTGSLMKVYNGPGLVAVKTGAQVLPVVIEGAQYSPFSRLKGRVRQRMFPKVRLTVMRARRLSLPAHLTGRDQREHAGDVLAELMVEMMFKANHVPQTLFERLLEARHVHGNRHVIAEDIQRRPMTYHQLLCQCLYIGESLVNVAPGRRIGVLAQGLDAYIGFWALHANACVPVMLPLKDDEAALAQAVRLAGIDTVIASQSFMQGLDSHIRDYLDSACQIIYIDQQIFNTPPLRRFNRAMKAHFDTLLFAAQDSAQTANDEAVVLFTSKGDGARKGVVLSHRSLLANMHQVNSRLALSPQDVVLNVLPLSQSFGLMAGAILPTLNGMRVFHYPNIGHSRIIPEIAYDISASVLFAGEHYLRAYAEAAHPYDFYSMRYVLAGADRVTRDTSDLWSEKFGLRVLQGYGFTEAGPVVAVNTPMEYRRGTVGRLLPGVEYHIDALSSQQKIGRLSIKGPNLMKGYIGTDSPDQLTFPASELGEGWFTTNDMIEMDEDGFISIAQSNETLSVNMEVTECVSQH